MANIEIRASFVMELDDDEMVCIRRALDGYRSPTVISASLLSAVERALEVTEGATVSRMEPPRPAGPTPAAEA